MNQNGGDQLSKEQKELVRTAVEEGYFKVPRQISLVGLSERLNMTDREVSEELRYALDRYLRDELLEDESS